MKSTAPILLFAAIFAFLTVFTATAIPAAARNSDYSDEFGPVVTAKETYGNGFAHTTSQDKWVGSKWWASKTYKDVFGGNNSWD